MRTHIKPPGSQAVGQPVRFELRRLTAGDDLTDVEELIARYEAEVAKRLRDHGLVLAELAPDAALLTEIDSVLAAPNALYVAIADGSTLATAALKHLGGGVGEVKRMYVDRAARGNGIGRTLLSALVDDAVAAGLELLRLETARWMIEAHGLYESFGFVDREDYDGREFGEIAAVAHLARLMELRLQRG